jgi:hypothetical protein
MLLYNYKACSQNVILKAASLLYTFLTSKQESVSSKLHFDKKKKTLHWAALPKYLKKQKPENKINKHVK